MKTLRTAVAGLAVDLVTREFGPADRWTERDLELAAAIWDACSTGHLHRSMTDDITVNPDRTQTVTDLHGGKRAVVAIAKAKAKQYGLTPSPSKWDDLIGNPVLYAAVLAA